MDAQQRVAGAPGLLGRGLVPHRSGGVRRRRRSRIGEVDPDLLGRRALEYAAAGRGHHLDGQRDVRGRGPVVGRHGVVPARVLRGRRAADHAVVQLQSRRERRTHRDDRGSARIGQVRVQVRIHRHADGEGERGDRGPGEHVGAGAAASSRGATTAGATDENHQTADQGEHSHWPRSPLGV
jgi:hypothetical protein